MGTSNIFRLRKLLDPQRQPSQHSTFQLLVTALEGFPLGHPYELSPAARAHLAAAVAAFNSGADVWEATPDTTHLFRICTIGSLVRNTGWRFYTNDRAAFDAVFARYHTSGGEWMPLSWFATGVLQNTRGFTWWTSLDLAGPEPWTLWRRVGLLDNWITHDTVILRCEVDAARVMVPTCLDGFDFPVFESVHDEPDPAHGRTIDLSLQPYRPGVPEYVIPALTTLSVEIRPLLVTKDMKQYGTIATRSPATWQLLEAYYSGLTAP